MREKGAELAEKYGDVIQQCFRSAYAHWFDKHRDELNIHRGRTRSNFVWDCTVGYLRTALGEDGKFRFIDTHGTTLMIYDQSLLIKVKKLNRGLRASNVFTYASEKFNHQKDLGFELNLTNVFLGYVPNDLNTEIEQIHIVCPNGDGVAWSVPVTAPVSQRVIDFKSDEVVTVPRKRIKLRNPRERSSTKNGS
jgi:hypothetical protein